MGKEVIKHLLTSITRGTGNNQPSISNTPGKFMQRNVRSSLNHVVLVPLLVEEGHGEGSYGTENDACNPRKYFEEVGELIAATNKILLCCKSLNNNIINNYV